jgi:hypothetical protein
VDIKADMLELVLGAMPDQDREYNIHDIKRTVRESAPGTRLYVMVGALLVLESQAKVRSLGQGEARRYTRSSGDHDDDTTS